MKKTLLTIIVYSIFSASLWAQTQSVQDDQKRLYSDYSEFYKNAAVNYDKTVAANEKANHISWAILVAMCLYCGVLVRKVQKRQRKHSEDMMAINRGNQELLREIRDALRTDARKGT